MNRKGLLLVCVVAIFTVLYLSMLAQTETPYEEGFLAGASGNGSHLYREMLWSDQEGRWEVVILDEDRYQGWLHGNQEFEGRVLSWMDVLVREEAQ